MKSSTETGLAFLTALKNGERSASPMAQIIHMQLIEVEAGKVIYKITPQAQHLNIQGGVHGGFGATALDTATGSAAHSVLAAGQGYATVDLNVKMIRPMQVNCSYYAHAELINAGRTLMITSGKIVDDQGKIYAYASATLMLIQH